MRMNRNIARVATTLLLAAACALPSPGYAQRAQPNGIKVGEGRLHPYFDLELRFDSASAYFVPTTGAAPQLGSEFITHFRPGLKLEVPGNAFALNLNGFADYVWYTGLITPGSQFASHLQGAVDLEAAFNQAGAVEVRLGDHFVRSDRSQNPAIGLGVLSLFNEARAAVAIHPGGRALEITPGFSYSFEFFDPLTTGVIPGCAPGNPLCDPGAVDALNYTNIGFHLDGRYKFLPKTALVLDADFGLRDYQGATPNTSLLSATAGISGLVSPKIALVAKAGWAQDFAGVFAKTVVGHLEVGYAASETANFRVGYVRTLQPVAALVSFNDDRGYLSGQALLGGKLTLRGYAAVDYLTFYGSPAAGGGRNDLVVSVDIGPQYQFTSWFSGAAGYLLSWRTVPSQPDNPANYTRNEGYLRLSLSY